MTPSAELPAGLSWVRDGDTRREAWCPGPQGQINQLCLELRQSLSSWERKTSEKERKEWGKEWGKWQTRWMIISDRQSHSHVLWFDNLVCSFHSLSQSKQNNKMCCSANQWKCKNENTARPWPLGFHWKLQLFMKWRTSVRKYTSHG